MKQAPRCLEHTSSTAHGAIFSFCAFFLLFFQTHPALAWLLNHRPQGSLGARCLLATAPLAGLRTLWSSHLPLGMLLALPILCG